MDNVSVVQRQLKMLIGLATCPCFTTDFLYIFVAEVTRLVIFDQHES
jgi:hypothetical protein